MHFTAILVAQDDVGQNMFSNIRFVADERISDDASTSEVMDAETFLQTALIASGASDEEIALYVEQLHKSVADCNQEIEKKAKQQENFSTADKVEQTLHFIYDTLITTYSEKQTRLDVAISDKSYNCVSSALLFMYFMKKQDIPVTANETPLHAFCTVQIEGKDVDVETTNPWGYNPGVKKQIVSDSLSQKKYVSVPAKKYANRHAVDDRRIIALVYANRIVLLQKQRNDEATIGLACDAERLQNSSEDAEKLLQQCVYNTAVNYSSDKKYEKGILLVKKARLLFDDCSLYDKYVYSAMGNLLNEKMESNSYDEAFTVLAQYQNDLNKSEYDEMLNTLTMNSLQNQIETKPFEDVLSEIEENKNNISSKNYMTIISYAYSHEASNIANTGDWLSAIALIDKGLTIVPNDSSLTNQRSVYKQNYSVTIHNKAAALYNSGDKEGARKIIEEGLKVFDDSSILKNDLQKMNKEL